MVDEIENVEPKYPETWDELKASIDVLNDFPDMVQANEFTPIQSVIFARSLKMLDDNMSHLVELGWFDNEKRKGRRRKNDDDESLYFSNVVVAGDSLFSQLAIDPEAYKKWSTGRDPFKLFIAYGALMRFYERQLGKSESSREPRKTVVSE